MAKHEKIMESRPKKRSGFGRAVLTDILLTGFILCIFAVFHHVIPRWGHGAEQDAVRPTVITTPTPGQESEQSEAVPTQEPEISAEPEITPEPVIDNRTPWQKNFEAHFTEEIVQSETGYSSPNVSVNITTHVEQINGNQQTYYVADIYIGQIENFRTGCASNGFTRFSEEDAVVLDTENNAIVQVNGDFCSVQGSGILVRNGELYYDDYTPNDICVLYYDGTVETYKAGTYEAQDIIDNLPYQIWKFGPVLLENDGTPSSEFNAEKAIKWDNPRTGFGYYEPGHYCFVVVDGRQSHSFGMTLEELAQIFADLGCTRAYNLDGGASSAMTFNDAVINKQSAPRKLGDTLYICEIPEAEQ